MSARNSLRPVIKKVDLLAAEIAHLRTAGPHFNIVHRFRMPGVSGCLTGEEVAAVFFVHRGREYQLRLSLTQRIIFDFLARHSRLAQSARQIEMGIRTDDFYTHHGMNVSGRALLTRRIPRSSIKEHVKRLHRALGWAFQEAGMAINPRGVLIAQDTTGNEVVYRLKATSSVTHLDLTSHDCQPL
jgi:hypothetical protein